MAEDGFVVQVNNDLLYESPDGREAWVIFDTGKRLAFISTDIHAMGQPNQTVGFSAETLRAIADRLDELTL